MTQLNAELLGAVAMASAVAGLFFLRFWRDTSDRLFLFFGIAFFLDAITRAVMATGVATDVEAICLVARLVTYLLIIYAIVHKNRPWKGVEH